jgi:hypothetical protein
MKLKVVKCEHCGSNKYSELSYGDLNYTMTCQICGQKSKSNFEYIEVPFPTVVLPDKTILKNLSTELELFFNEENGFPFGVNIKVFTHDKSNNSDYTFLNRTEFHYLYESYDEESVAFESDLLGEGCTMGLNKIKFISICKANELINKH